MQHPKQLHELAFGRRAFAARIPAAAEGRLPARRSSEEAGQAPRVPLRGRRARQDRRGVAPVTARSTFAGTAGRTAPMSGRTHDPAPAPGHPAGVHAGTDRAV